MDLVSGAALARPCNASMHGRRPGLLAVYLPTEQDPDCQTCMARAILAEHNHLHLDGAPCEAPGLSGPGQMVKCKCGGFHH